MTQQQRVKAPRPSLGAGSLRVGRLTKPHGLKGGLKLELYTDNPDLRFVPGAVFYLQVPTDSVWFEKTVTVRELRYFNGQAVVFFEELSDRTAAESIARAILWIDEQQVLAGEEDDAWYDQQLIGMRVLVDGKDVGEVSEVKHLPAQDLLEVDTGDNKVLVPLVKAIVPEVDTAKRVIHVTPPTGLFHDEDAEVAA